ncbi:polysaccharide deacetylase family protein [Jiella avicenniae]|uniref:Polysaccharide deacetylase family protein n=1 Tax=Jiella avicenniae TaxID=2907202 RepID=A0A9X1T661_9HYPH|nr:polysaccharide deacetylase family protein [Jiella avicenniae]MCE7030296.1 polysaccharide deacetylase family protein [Jiella avicenniae]
MSVTATRTGSDFPRSAAALDRLSGEGRQVSLWWRDDDARSVTPELDRLLGLAKRHALPLALAVIPVGAELALAERLAGEAGVSVLLHGHAHANHASPGEKRAEFGDHRPADVMRGEIVAGKARLEDLFADRFRPVFVPPWNRIGRTARALLAGLGLPTLSVYGAAKDSSDGEPAELNTHLDVMDWRAMRGLTFDAADGRLAALIDGRTGSAAVAEPIGLLTHHLQHDESAWALTDRLLGLLVAHPAVVRDGPALLPISK